MSKENGNLIEITGLVEDGAVLFEFIDMYGNVIEVISGVGPYKILSSFSKIISARVSDSSEEIS
jgi:hypothetical protein